MSKNRILNGAQGHPHPKGPWPRRGYVIRTNIDGKREIERESEWMTNRAFEPLLIRADLTVEPYFSQPLVPGPKIPVTVRYGMLAGCRACNVHTMPMTPMNPVKSIHETRVTSMQCIVTPECPPLIPVRLVP